MKTLKKPLTPAKEGEYLQQMQAGDAEAKNLLIEHNLRLVAHIVKKYASAEKETEDLLSIGTIGLIKAIGTFDYGRGNRLSSYAAKCIENEILMYLRSEKKRNREFSIYEPIGTDKEGNTIAFVDIIESTAPDVVDHLVEKEEISLLYQGYGTLLNEKEKTVIRMRYGLFGGQECTQRQVADYLGISRSYVSRIEKKALSKLAEQFTNAGRR